MIDGILSGHLGDDYYSGTTNTADVWPYMTAGDRGICNTMAPEYCNLSALAEIEPKVPILLFQGENDTIVSDHSGSDINVAGERGLIPGWPGADAAPAQPMVSQTRKLLDRYINPFAGSMFLMPAMPAISSRSKKQLSFI